jgi:two-component system chemotaxis response regulator CheY
MTVLVCDDDPSARFVIKRLLTQQLGCTIAECGDGIEALSRLDQGDIDLVVLDIQMPQMDGVEVLEAIRAMPALKGMPVIMVSSERREEVVLKLVRLGIDGYVLKPLRSEKVLAALDPLRPRLRSREGRSRSGASMPSAFGPDSPVMLVEGNPDYRHFFASQASSVGPIVEAPSGAVALGLFRQSPVRLVFVGADVGVLRGELLVQKLRAIAASQPLRLVAVADGATAADAHKLGFDDVMPRSFLPDTFRAELRKFAQIPGSTSVVTAMLGDVEQAITSAARQVFGMMLDVELQEAVPSSASASQVQTSADITVHGRYVLVFSLWATVPSLMALSARMLGTRAEEVTEQDYLSTGGELVNLIVGRLHAFLDERHIRAECSLPRTENHAVPPAAGGEERAAQCCLAVPGTPIEIQMTVDVRASSEASVG